MTLSSFRTQIEATKRKKKMKGRTNLEDTSTRHTTSNLINLRSRLINIKRTDYYHIGR
ncbi:hypothetical protein HanXRQr2_Chr01g0036161 [Helianthus annuus]|uniref:Uncharacterized protein n=1 Tax=Helianthus annuus TaxID=4232 RepID=A0A9K3P4K7_HELAN|nr:hypothetical protein HanXRQr2_Chr01g0036161 [Helianthus annuus]